jgi:DNA-binding GntR family transcriptional regulator
MSDTGQAILRKEVLLTLHPLKRPRTLTEQAADAIRARIVSGDFQPGEALSEITLAAELGVSKTPVREAFLQLKNEGLVDIQPQRGTFVFQMSSEQIRQLTVLRELLESQALRIAMREDHRLLGGMLKGVIARMASAVAEGDSRLYRALDNEFHHHIIVACGNQFIEAAYSNIAFRVHALRNRLALQPPQNDRSLREHQDIAELIAGGDVERSASGLLEHIRATLREYSSLVQGLNGAAS